jgi:hypothetical protein
MIEKQLISTIKYLINLIIIKIIDKNTNYIINVKKASLFGSNICIQRAYLEVIFVSEN